MTVGVMTRRFTVEEYHRMREAGILSEDDPVELIEGELIEMSPIGSRHAACVKRLAALLFERSHRRFLVSVQDPIRLSDHSEPQPDLALLRPRGDFYASAHPGPGDVLLVIEVAESSGEYDRERKLPLYARSGIPEAWVVDLERGEVVVGRDPSPEGYRALRIARRGETLSPLAFPDFTLLVDELLG
ncbi:Uma2 family endonuclease [Thermoflexus sp.]|uniref:Uma2 family endonuclease n=2 Tax=Thermoflexus sp. TaxID=1969742 RepID=UPI00260C6834|nr:Uma2 family endonuclease [Thermoflexus sp.]MCX7689839.1 Uma2 family endonuclease [Thermoflexus sp.]